MKKVIALMLALTVVLLVACKPQTSVDPTDANATSGADQTQDTTAGGGNDQDDADETIDEDWEFPIDVDDTFTTPDGENPLPTDDYETPVDVDVVPPTTGGTDPNPNGDSDDPTSPAGETPTTEDNNSTEFEGDQDVVEPTEPNSAETSEPSEPVNTTVPTEPVVPTTTKSGAIELPLIPG